MYLDFNPRFPWGKRRAVLLQIIPTLIFQSTLPVGEATVVDKKTLAMLGISIHASRGGSDVHGRGSFHYSNVISIHASRGGSDRCRAAAVRGVSHFNPRFPWGKRLSLQPLKLFDRLFQSTLPVGEATSCKHEYAKGRKISIHASRGGSDRTA
mgnify:CR=1 FL=1